jgi:hypothetical protein
MRDILQEIEFAAVHGKAGTDSFFDQFNEDDQPLLGTDRWRDWWNECDWAEEDYGGISSHSRKATLPVGENWNPVKF